MTILKDIKDKLKKKSDDKYDESSDGLGDQAGSGSESVNTTKDDDENQPRFVKKDEKKEEKSEEMEEAEEEVDRQEIVENLSHDVRPESNQQRNLDRETGGFEENKKEGHYTGKDAWDDRSEEVDKMGSTDVFNTTGMRSVVWKKKRERLNAKKQLKEIAKEVGAATAKTSLNPKNFNPEKQTFDSRVDFIAPPKGYVAKLKNLKVDHSHEPGHGGIGR